MPKILIKQTYKDGSSSVIYEWEKNKVVLFTGLSPNVDSAKVITKDKIHEELRNESELKEKEEA